MTEPLDDARGELETRVHQFQALELPGQPMGMHMGTMYLVNDLWREVQRLRAASAPQSPDPACGNSSQASQSIASLPASEGGGTR